MKTTHKIVTALSLAFALFLLPAAASHAYTQQDVQNLLDANDPPPSGCTIWTESYTQICTQQGEEVQKQGIKVWKRCNARVVTRREDALVDESLITIIKAVECCSVGSCVDYGAWELVNANQRTTFYYCDGPPSVSVTGTGRQFLKRSPGNKGFLDCNYYNYYYYPTVWDLTTNCRDYDTLLKNFYPVCSNNDRCCCNPDPCCMNPEESRGR